MIIHPLTKQLRALFARHWLAFSFPSSLSHWKSTVNNRGGEGGVEVLWFFPRGGRLKFVTGNCERGGGSFGVMDCAWRRVHGRRIDDCWEQLREHLMQETNNFSFGMNVMEYAVVEYEGWFQPVASLYRVYVVAALFTRDYRLAFFYYSI